MQIGDECRYAGEVISTSMSEETVRSGEGAGHLLVVLFGGWVEEGQWWYMAAVG